MSNPSAEVWFDYVMTHKAMWARGFTIRRLEKVRKHIMDDSIIVGDLIRHSASKESPYEMKADDPYRYQHCIDNFICNIQYKMIQLKILNIDRL